MTRSSPLPTQPEPAWEVSRLKALFMELDDAALHH